MFDIIADRRCTTYGLSFNSHTRSQSGPTKQPCLPQLVKMKDSDLPDHAVKLSCVQNFWTIEINNKCQTMTNKLDIVNRNWIMELWSV